MKDEGMNAYFVKTTMFYPMGDTVIYLTLLHSVPLPRALARAHG